MKQKIFIGVAALLIFYIGAEVGYWIAYDSVTCIRIVPANGHGSFTYL